MNKYNANTFPLAF